ncbi:unnamed protein product [Orchesella dallaii]|uniref:N-acetyltransferase domain-containing protein n=1 Tax=Orchesella dallaii TaxID=48710 RepID=A0ABP1QPZ8_9HEXA
MSVHNSNQEQTSLSFRFLENTEEIREILEVRLPKSANVYNLSRVYSNFKKPEEMAFYVMCLPNNEPFLETTKAKLNESGTWILVTYFREDYGMRYAVSAPGNVEITPEIKKAFTESQYINWNAHYHFSCIDFGINQMIWEISTKHFGNSVSSMPCKIFVMGKEQAASLHVDIPRNEENGCKVELNSLSSDVAKGTRFICQTWKYSIPGKTDLAIEKLLRKNKSVGLYRRNGSESGEILCGMLTNDCGLMGMLHTVPEHRGKGYATLVTKKLMKNLAAENGAVPCSAVEMRNYQSIAFHEKLGMNFSHYADFIKYVPQTWS